MAITKVMRMHGKIAADTDDLIQDSWINVCKGYDAERGQDSVKWRTESDNANLAYLLKVNPRILEKGKDAVSPVSGFAYRVAYRVALDYVRGRYRAACLESLDHADDNEPSLLDTLSDQSPDCVSAMQRAAKEYSVCQAVDALSAVEHDAIVTYLDDERAMTGGERIAKVRAISHMQESILA